MDSKQLYLGWLFSYFGFNVSVFSFVHAKMKSNLSIYNGTWCWVNRKTSSTLRLEREKKGLRLLLCFLLAHLLFNSIWYLGDYSYQYKEILGTSPGFPNCVMLFQSQNCLLKSRIKNFMKPNLFIFFFSRWSFSLNRSI